MPLPFYPIGAILAIAVLAGLLSLFGFALHLLDRGATEFRGSILPGLVAGVRNWAVAGDRSTLPAVSASSVDPSGGTEDQSPDPAVRLEAVRARRW